MTTLTNTTRAVTGGVDTHGQTHHAAVLDDLGRPLGDREFPTTPAGYRALLTWLQTHGHVQRVGVEGTGSYGPALSRHLRAAGIAVVEVDRPDRKARRAHGKSDPRQAQAGAVALGGQDTHSRHAEHHRCRRAAVTTVHLVEAFGISQLGRY